MHIQIHAYADKIRRTYIPDVHQLSKPGGHHVIFGVLEVKRSKILQNYTKKTVFVYILSFMLYGVSRAKTDIHNKYIIQLCLAHFLNKIIY